ncbi:hypothetical protein GCM10009827_083920 [Dactylosporangium maewongense]|uniref:Uncharacterized protein n=1 Tax=Dactylosporangium maewongense TaxID=634393 RepID=A0ABP4MUF1_9ACTN
MTALPTPAEMLARADAELGAAHRALSAAADWLRSDWPPGHVLTDEQAGQRAAMRRAISAAQAAIRDGRL